MFLKGAVEGGLGFIADLRPHLRDADARNREASRRQLHAPLAEIVHGRNTDVVSKAIGKHRSREADFVGEELKGPFSCRLPMDQSHGVSDVSVPEPG